MARYEFRFDDKDTIAGTFAGLTPDPPNEVEDGRRDLLFVGLDDYMLSWLEEHVRSFKNHQPWRVGFWVYDTKKRQMWKFSNWSVAGENGGTVRWWGAQGETADDVPSVILMT